MWGSRVRTGEPASGEMSLEPAGQLKSSRKMKTRNMHLSVPRTLLDFCANRPRLHWLGFWA